MNKPKCSEYLYVQFLISAQNNFTCTEFSNVSPIEEMSHDSINRMLVREKLTPNILWKNTKHCVDFNSGYLIVDDTVLDKPRAQDMDLTHWQYSGARHDVVKGIGLESLLWTNDFDHHIPVDFRIYDKDSDGKTKNNHFQEMLLLAKHRGFNPSHVLFDSWYATLDNLKFLDKLFWKWITQLPKNRLVSLEPHKHQQLEELNIPNEGLTVHLKGYGLIKVFKQVSDERNFGYYATNDFNLSKSDVERIYSRRWKIEEYHQGLKQQCGVSKCQSRKARNQRNHIWCSIHAFLTLELHRIKHGTTWHEAKLSIARSAIYQYLLAPRFTFEFATA
jgi:putative transposase